ncbi:hypothetical protein BC332_14224 [Capsicum chinense]|nr:hypothetical protein BC332_14224 [Capsicum chinense]
MATGIIYETWFPVSLELKDAVVRAYRTDPVHFRKRSTRRRRLHIIWCWCWCVHIISSLDSALLPLPVTYGIPSPLSSRTRKQSAPPSPPSSQPSTYATLTSYVSVPS